jgi:hypothetical protein
LFFGEFPQRRERGDSGVRDDDVEPTEFRDALRNCCFECGGVADVGLDGQNTSVELLNEFGGQGEIILCRAVVRGRAGGSAVVDRDDVCAFLR